MDTYYDYFIKFGAFEEANPPTNSKFVIVAGVVTYGSTLMNTYDFLINAGHQVVMCFAVFDRECRQEWSSHVPLRSLFNRTDIQFVAKSSDWILQPDEMGNRERRKSEVLPKNDSVKAPKSHDGLKFYSAVDAHRVQGLKITCRPINWLLGC